jgi:hypothetical protein
MCITASTIINQFRKQVLFILINHFLLTLMLLKANNLSNAVLTTSLTSYDARYTVLNIEHNFNLFYSLTSSLELT